MLRSIASAFCVSVRKSLIESQGKNACSSLSQRTEALHELLGASRKRRTKKLLVLQFKLAGSSVDVDRRCLERSDCVALCGSTGGSTPNDLSRKWLRSVVCPERDFVWLVWPTLTRLSSLVSPARTFIRAKVDWHLTQPGENRSNYVFVINAVSCLPFPSMLKIKRAHPEWRASAFRHKANEQCET